LKGTAQYVLRRSVQSVITFFVVLVVTFVIIRLRGNPLTYYIGNPRIPAEVIQQLIREWGFYDPIHVQFIRYLNNLIHLDLGYSFHYKRAVADLLATYLPWTVWLLGLSTTISIVVSIFIGSYLATKYGGRLDKIIVALGLTIRSFPVFWIGMIILYYFAYVIRLFPLNPTTYLLVNPPRNILEWISALLYISALPVTALTLIQLGGNIIVMRGMALSVATDDYVTSARAVGFSEWYVLRKVVIRNAILPMTTFASLNYALMLSGAVITETVFSYPGIGWLIYQAVLQSDYYLIQGAFIVLCVVVIVFNFITDLLYMILDPRVKLR